MPNYDMFPVTYVQEVVAASDTDEPLVAAVTNHRIVVVQLAFVAGDTDSSVLFESEGSSDTVLWGPVVPGSNGVVVLPYSNRGWFATVKGEALTATTGAGSDTPILLGYVLD